MMPAPDEAEPEPLAHEHAAILDLLDRVLWLARRVDQLEAQMKGGSDE